MEFIQTKVHAEIAAKTLHVCYGPAYSNPGEKDPLNTA